MSPEQAVEALHGATRHLTRAEVLTIVEAVREEGYNDGVHDSTCEVC